MWREAFATSTLPVQGTVIAQRWDHLYEFLLGLSALFFVLVIGAIAYFAWRYRETPGRKPKYIEGHIPLEVLWTAVPTVLVMVIFVWGYVVYRDMRQIPQDALTVRVIGKQWSWQFQYENGTTTTNELYVPLNEPVKLIMTSEDVIHSFFIPAFRIKRDVVPGLYATLWFEATVSGRHVVYCAEYCGTAHSAMLAYVNVLDGEQWKRFGGKKIILAEHGAGGARPVSAAQTTAQLTTAQPVTAQPTIAQLTLVEQGRRVTESQGCVACHSSDGTAKAGPSYKGRFGQHVELADGKKAWVDENYIRESLEKPNAKIAKGYQPLMPTFQGMLTEQELHAVVAYIRSLK